jgi:replicative DNA helicase
MFYAVSAENALIGMAIKDNFYLDELNTRLSSQDLSSQNALILDKLNMLCANDIRADKIAVMDSNIEGVDEDHIDYLMSLGTKHGFEGHLEMVEAEKLKRIISYSCTEIAETLRIKGLNRNSIAEMAEKHFSKISSSVVRDTGSITDMSDGVEDGLKQVRANALKEDGITGIASGFKDLDTKTCGFQKTDLIIVAGRPSMGKTTVSYNMAEFMCMNGNRGMFFSLEMPKSQIMQRSFSSIGLIEQNKLKTGKLSQFEFGKLAEAARAIKTMDLVIDDQGGLSIHELRLRAKKKHAEKPLQFILIDYLQLIKAPEAGPNKNLEVTIISAGLKELAKELEVPVIVLSQLNRSLEQRADKRPINSDLRDSGSVEQDADLILFIYRDEIYHEDSPDIGIGELIIGKHRSGPLGTIKLQFKGEFSKFENIRTQIIPEKEDLPEGSLEIST